MLIRLFTMLFSLCYCTLIQDAQKVADSVWHLADQVTFYATLRSFPIMTSIEECLKYNNNLATYGYCLVSSDCQGDKNHLQTKYQDTLAKMNDILIDFDWYYSKLFTAQNRTECYTQLTKNQDIIMTAANSLQEYLQGRTTKE